MSEVRRVILLMSQDIGFCREVIRGVRAYAIGKKPWVFQDGPPEPAVVDAFRTWRPHGLVAQLLTRDVARTVKRLRKPVVDISCTLPKLKLPLVDADHAAVGRLAAEHFLERGYRQFGFFGSEWAYFSNLREASFRQRLAEAGCTVSSCYVEYLLRLRALTEWKEAAQRVEQWLVGLPKPVAILASNDIPARDLADICLQRGLQVPEEVAILGVDNDDLECGLTSPPLSSVATPARRVGFEAAHLLDQMMEGEAVAPEPLFLPPLGVVARQSTDTLAVDDPTVVGALAYIREHATEGIGVDDVAEHTLQGRRMLEYKFRELLGHTILDEIRRARIQRVKELLTETDLKMHAIARRTGFATPQRMAIVFRQATGRSPAEYRRELQVRGS